MTTNIYQKYEDYCKSKGIPYQLNDKVNLYNETTLFCPAGMQQFKEDFQNESIKDKTIANVQSCLRVNDYDEIGDGTHLIYFNMIGLFSFRQMSLKEAIDFWTGFIEDELKLKLDYVTIHPDKLDDWSSLYDKKYTIKPDEECTWSDGTSETAYCTEFYINNIEIGNIVNPKGNCIDAGFGLERLDMLVNKHESIYHDREFLLKEAVQKIIESGYKPSYTSQGYILRKILRDLYKMGKTVEESHPIYSYYKSEIDRQKNMKTKYLTMKDTKKGRNKSKQWWFDTHGVDLNCLDLED